jgi:hypothetical protein
MLNAVLQRLVDERTHLHEAVDQVLASANDEERDPSEAETELLERHRTRLEELEPQIEGLLRTEETRQGAADARAFLQRATPRPETDPEGAPAGEVVYRNFGQYARDEIIRRFPMIASRAEPGAREAAEARLNRAMENTLLADIPGLLSDQHLAQITDVISNARPVVGASRSIGLTSGKVTYPKITQRPDVGPQAVEKTELVSRKMTVALNEAAAKVYGGSGDLSWQDIVWSNPDALALWFDLAAEAYAMETEGVTCTEATAAATTGGTVAIESDDLSGWMAAISAAAGQVYADTRRAANVIAADIATGYKLLGMVSDVAPVFISAGAGSIQTGSGTVAGLRLVISYGFTGPTVIVGDFNQLLTAENSGAPVELRAVEPSIAGFEVGVVGAFLAEAMEPSAFRALTPPAQP